MSVPCEMIGEGRSTRVEHEFSNSLVYEAEFIELINGMALSAGGECLKTEMKGFEASLTVPPDLVPSYVCRGVCCFCLVIW